METIGGQVQIRIILVAFHWRLNSGDFGKLVEEMAQCVGLCEVFNPDYDLDLGLIQIMT